METYVNVLGTEYKIITGVDAKSDPMLATNSGYCDYTTKTIIVADYQSLLDNPIMGFDNPDNYVRATIRHELIHAFLQESGLMASSWADNEEMVDWFALQFPKINKVFETLKVTK